MKILIVEDDAQVRTALDRVLRKSGHEVSQAFTAEAAMRLLATESFDVVLLDIVLGNEHSLSGWTVAGFMQTTQRLRDVRIIIISGLKPDQIRDGARQYANLLETASIIISKPLDFDILEVVLAGVVKKKEQ